MNSFSNRAEEVKMCETIVHQAILLLIEFHVLCSRVLMSSELNGTEGFRKRAVLARYRKKSTLVGI